MEIYELLSTIRRLAAENDLDTPYIVGGVPRDRIMNNREKKIKDVDLTTGSADTSKLARLLANNLKDAKYKTYDDGHSSVDIQGLRIDFSNHFLVRDIDNILKNMGIIDITPMKREIFSRDFTMNTLLEDLDFNNVYDLTGEGINDINAGILKCPIDPDITIGNDARRILRALYFSLKYGMKIEDKLKLALLKYRNEIKQLPLQFVQNKMHDIVKLDADKGIELLIEYKLLPLVELSSPLYNSLISKRKLHNAF